MQETFCVDAITSFSQHWCFWLYLNSNDTMHLFSSLSY